MKLFDTINSGGIYVIAEMSANHAGKLENALEIVRAAKNAGADCLKVQTYTPDTLTLDCDNDYFKIKGGLWDGYRLYDLYKEAAMPWEWQKSIKEECESCGLDFLSTPFDNTAVDFLEGLDVSFYKIASFELVDIPLIEYAAGKKKPMILSCGMASPEEIQDALEACHRQGNHEVVLLKCCSEYPADFADMNLMTISDMAQRFMAPIGLSDHSMGHMAAVVAASLGAKVIEKHFCLSRCIKNPDSEFSMEPQEFSSMVSALHDVIKIKGTATYKLTEKETASTAFRRSLFAIADIQAGESFTKDNIASKRPNYGAPPKYYDKLLGKPSSRSYKKGEPIEPGEMRSLLNKQTAFESDRLYFQGIDSEDCDRILCWRNSLPDNCFAARPALLTLQMQLDWYQNSYLNDNSRIDFLIREKDEGCPIGVVGVKNLDYSGHKGEISYLIGEPEARGKGYAAESVRALCALLNENGITVICAKIYNSNMESKAIVMKNGFCLVAELPEGYEFYERNS